MGLNEGLEQARFDAVADDIGTMIILHGDLPNLQAADVHALTGALPSDGSPGVAIAPDRAGTGTNALVLRPPGLIGFRFGPGSFARHLAEVDAAGVPLVAVNRAGLAFDLDTPEDLARWLELGDAA
jgi:2-phospho-L-lactate guanylyltransferase